MRILVTSCSLEKIITNLLIISFFEDHQVAIPEYIKPIDTLMGGIITNIIKEGEFTGKLCQTTLIHTQNKVASKRILLLGLGKKEKFNFGVVRLSSGKAALQVRELGISDYASLLHGEEECSNNEPLSQALVEGSELALYTFSQYKSSRLDLPKIVKFLKIVLRNKSSLKGVRRGIECGIVTSEATILARNLTNTPSNDCSPNILAEKAKGIAEKYNIKFNVLELKDLKRLGMGGLLGVACGSSQPPKFIILEYLGGDKTSKPIILIGKAVTFDSGGISIKPSEKMEDMKYDKAGGVSVIATMQGVAKLKLKLNIVGLIPATENLPSGSAFKPGDVLSLYGGKTVEVISTDAEGRLILADALAYACIHYDAQALIDLATLTGACVTALGANVSGLFVNNRDLKLRIKKAADASGDKVWELPLWDDYLEQIKSNLADIKNTGGRPAGAITAAAFLSQFVKNKPWAHLDIAGTAYTQDGSYDKTYIPKGATGVGVSLILNLLKEWGSEL